MTPAGADDLWAGLRDRVDPDRLRWLEEAVEAVRRDPAALARAFPAVGRRVGRERLGPGDGPAEHDWTVDDAGRALLLLAAGAAAGDELDDLYRFGDAAERRGVLRALALLPPSDAGLALVEDAIRSNDPRLLAAALGPYGRARLDEPAFDQAVLKCIFLGVPLAGLAGVAGRATPTLARMVAGYVRERVAAGRDVPPDVWPLIEAHPPGDELAALEAERDHPLPARRRAAAAALAHRDAYRRGQAARAAPAADGHAG